MKLNIIKNKYFQTKVHYNLFTRPENASATSLTDYSWVHLPTGNQCYSITSVYQPSKKHSNILIYINTSRTISRQIHKNLSSIIKIVSSLKFTYKINCIHFTNIETLSRHVDNNNDNNYKKNEEKTASTAWMRSRRRGSCQNYHTSYATLAQPRALRVHYRDATRN